MSSAQLSVTPLSKRKLAVRDSLVFATLSLVTLVLFVITLFLFHSFESHRLSVGQQWSSTGKSLLNQGRAREAVSALRTALSFEPNDRDDQLLLAQALSRSGQIEEATNYYLNLWEARPGDGNVNLQLARLARAAGKANDATTYYRAAIFGTWQGDGIERRRETRLELADYLIERGQDAAARAELLIAAGNNPETEDLDLGLADRLRKIGDLEDAMSFYRRGTVLEPHNSKALEGAGRAAFDLGRFEEAGRYLRRASQYWSGDQNESQRSDLDSLIVESQRARDLDLSDDLPSDVRAKHIVLASAIAEKRMASCLTQTVDASVSAQTQPRSVSTDILILSDRWSEVRPNLLLKILRQNPALQDRIVQLIFDSEAQTTAACGKPVADDAVLSVIAKTAVQTNQ